MIGRNRPGHNHPHRRSFARAVAARALAVWTGLLAVGRPARAAVVPSATPMPGAEDKAEPGQGVSFDGHVVELETGKSVAGASILVERLVRGADPRSIPPWAGESTIRTDADGRFRLTFPPEQVADRRLSITLRVTQPGFIPRKSWETDLVSLVRGQAMGDRPFFETVTIEKGVEYTGQVMTPLRKPAADLPYHFVNWMGTEGHSPHFNNEYQGRTDAEGRFRLRMPRTQGLALYLACPPAAEPRFPYAPYQHFYGTAQPGQHPDVWAPTDFGRIVLKRGVLLSGRLVDTEGQPIAGQTITAYPVAGNEDRHSATTEADGSFVLGPLRHANYRIYGEGQDGFGGVDRFAPPLRSSARVIKPVKVYLEKDVVPEPLVLREDQRSGSRSSSSIPGEDPLSGAPPGSGASFPTHRAWLIRPAPFTLSVPGWPPSSMIPSRGIPATGSTGVCRPNLTPTAGSSSAFLKACSTQF